MKHCTVGIIGGKGKMGQFFARFFEHNGCQVLISDKRTKLTNTQVARKSDIVIISVPMDKVEHVIEEVGPHMKKRDLLMDVNSIKEPVLKKMLECSKSAVLGCHPLFGPTNVLQGQVCVFCSGRGKKWETLMKDLFEQNGAEVRFLKAREHDELMTIVQGLMHFLDIAATKTLQSTRVPIKKYFDFRSPSYRLKLDLMGRTLFQDANLYGNIQMQNPQTVAVLKKFFHNAHELLSIIEENNMKEFQKYWTECQKYLGDMAEVCQAESDEIIDFLSAASASHDDTWIQDERVGNLGVLGPENTFSHLAAQKFFPKEKSLVFFRTIPEMFLTFEKKKVQNVFLPVENKIHGTVGETLDGLFESSGKIQAMFSLPIHLTLAGLHGSKLKKIQKISSHPQALAQCSDVLKKILPHAELVPASSTAIALHEILKKSDPCHAVICATQAAQNMGLNILATDISNTQENETRFILLSHEKDKILSASSKFQSSVVFYFDHDSPGSLASVLSDFSGANINLTKIESRPAGRNFGEYLFFLDFEGKIYNDAVQEVLTKVEHKVAMLKVLGSYPLISKA